MMVLNEKKIHEAVSNSIKTFKNKLKVQEKPIKTQVEREFLRYK
jgi:hypothetical protein